MRKGVVQLYIKNNEVIFSLAWNIIFSDNWKVLVLKFLEMKNMVFLSQKVDGNMIFTDYWKVLVLNFSVMGNMAFFRVKKLMEKMIFTDYGKVLVLNFSVVGNTVFFWVKKLTERWYLLVTQFLFWTFRWWEIRSFFQPKSWWKGVIYLVFLSFPWYSRTWKIWFLVQCSLVYNIIPTDLYYTLQEMIK